MNKATTGALAGLTGIAAAAAAVYLFDPQNGRKRRSELGDRCKSAAKQLNERTRGVSHDISDRYHGASTRVQSWFNSGSRADSGLARRVRIDLWRGAPGSGTIGVVAHNGEVILHGDVLPQKHLHVLQVARGVEGVVSVADHLIETAQAIPQKSGPRLQQGFTRVRDSLMQEHWSPPTRVCSGALGLALLRWGVQHRNVAGGIGALTGAVLLVRSSTNMPLKRLAGRRKQVEDPLPGRDFGTETITHVGNNLSGSSEWRESAAGGA